MRGQREVASVRCAVLAVLAAAALLVSLPRTADVAGKQFSQDNSDSPSLQTANHDLAVNYVTLVGPAAVNLSDTNGRYMWVLSAVRNASPHNELVNLNLTFNGDMPNGCERIVSLLLPGQTSFFMSPGEDKTVIWRVRYFCHTPAVPQTLRQTATVAITHCDPATSEPGPVTAPTPGGVCPVNSQTGGSETNLANNAASASKQILVQ